MPGSGYDRYGLTGNPFRELASENVEDVEIFHVNLDVDRVFQTIREEALDKENRAVVAIVGEHGSGKTERLRVAAAEARANNAFLVMAEVPPKAPSMVRNLAGAFHTEANARGLAKTFSAPPWLKEISALEKMKGSEYDPVQAGRAFAAAMNGAAPAFLLLNDLHNLAESKEAELFVRMLQEISDSSKPGVLVAFVCFPSYLAWLSTKFPPLVSRINRTILLPKLSNDEAGLILAKKLLAKRVVEELDPLYPFDPDSVAILNEASNGNARRLLTIADRALEYGAEHRAYRIDADLIRALVVDWAKEEELALPPPTAAPPSAKPGPPPARADPAPRPVAKSPAASP